MKKILLLLLVFIIVISTVSCGEEKNVEGKNNTETENQPSGTPAHPPYYVSVSCDSFYERNGDTVTVTLQVGLGELVWRDRDNLDEDNYPRSGDSRRMVIEDFEATETNSLYYDPDFVLREDSSMIINGSKGTYTKEYYDNFVKFACFDDDPNPSYYEMVTLEIPYEGKELLGGLRIYFGSVLESDRYTSNGIDLYYHMDQEGIRFSFRSPRSASYVSEKKVIEGLAGPGIS